MSIFSLFSSWKRSLYKFGYWTVLSSLILWSEIIGLGWAGRVFGSRKAITTHSFTSLASKRVRKKFEWGKNWRKWIFGLFSLIFALAELQSLHFSLVSRLSHFQVCFFSQVPPGAVPEATAGGLLQPGLLPGFGEENRVAKCRKKQFFLGSIRINFPVSKTNSSGYQSLLILKV